MTSRTGDRSRAGWRRWSRDTSERIACTLNKLTRISREPTPLQLARLLRGAAVDKKAWDAVVIDVRDKTSIADYFVVCEGETDRQVRAIADGMVSAAKDRHLRPIAAAGYDDTPFIFPHFNPLLPHVFLPPDPSPYSLDG